MATIISGHRGPAPVLDQEGPVSIHRSGRPKQLDPYKFLKEEEQKLAGRSALLMAEKIRGYTNIGRSPLLCHPFHVVGHR